MEQITAKILQNTQIAPGFFDLRAAAPDAAQLAQPGQCAHIACGEKQLRRPISICEAQNGVLRFIYEVRGEGTAILSGLKAGEGLDILAPLGRGFRLNNVKKVLLIGGGIGVPPLLGVARQHCRLSGIEAEAVLGFRTKSAAILLEDFSKTVQAVHVATDDGTLQAHGTVTDTVRSRLEKVRFDLICACGPTPMLKTVAALAEEFSVACQVSLEERMACGVGACLVCACALKGKKQYAHVCKDGPVFDYMEVVF